MNNIVIKNEEKIYEVRGTLVMLDSDLAKLYNMETKRLNENVKNNLSKFGNSTFVLTSEEYLNLRSKIATSSWNNYGGRRNNPRVFTYEGIKILNSLLRRDDKEIILAKIQKSFTLKNKDSMALSPVNTAKIKNLIYEIRGKQVMLDSDLAKLYKCKNGTKTINLAVKRHPNRFPERYMFQLTEAETKIFWFQIETKKINIETRGGKFNRPYVFTEQGVAMLSSVLKTSVAEQVSLSIMDAFVEMRHFLLENQDIFKSINNINNHLALHDNQIAELFAKFAYNTPNQLVFLEGQIYDAYSKLIDIMNEAQEKLIIIDSYADKTTLDMLAKVKCPVILITKHNLNLQALDLAKYQEQYDNLTIIYDNSFHDRFLIIDDKIIYHCGTSLNHAGNKTFALNKLSDPNILPPLLNTIKNIIKTPN